MIKKQEFQFGPLYGDASPMGGLDRRDRLEIKQMANQKTETTEHKKILRVLRDFHRPIEKALDMNHEVLKQTNGAITCHRGCNACCELAVDVDINEALRLVLALRSQPDYEDILDKMRQAASVLEEVNNDTLEYHKRHIKCPVLKNRDCRVYDDRPLMCRNHISWSDPSLCAIPGAPIQQTNAQYVGIKVMLLQYHALKQQYGAVIIGRLPHMFLAANEHLHGRGFDLKPPYLTELTDVMYWELINVAAERGY